MINKFNISTYDNLALQQPDIFSNLNYLKLTIYSTDNAFLETIYTNKYWGINGLNISIDLKEILNEYNYYSGAYRVLISPIYYIIGDEYEYCLAIDEISDSRFEVRVVLSTLTSDNIISFNNILNISNVTSLSYQQELSLLFESLVNTDQSVISNNWVLDNITYSTSPHSIIFKLKEELSNSIVVGDKLNVIQPLADDHVISVICNLAEFERQVTVLNGANLQINTRKLVNKETDWENWNNLFPANQAINRKLKSKYSNINNGIDLNIDYTDFNNFVFYSSIADRLDVFRYKIKLIESYTDTITQLSSSIADEVSSSLFYTNNILSYENKIQEVLDSFDGYENYLYYTSGSIYYGNYISSSANYITEWPKTNSIRPYVLANSSDQIVIDWFETIKSIALEYDKENDNKLINLIPFFIIDDPNYGFYYNRFINMIGHHFDNIYLYIQSLSNIINRDQSLYSGLAKDLIYDVIGSFGFGPRLDEYQFNTLWEYLMGTNEFGEYQVSQSNEEMIYVNSESLPRNDINKEILKRLLNNIPYLLKTKGTHEGAQAILNCYGIPSTILRIREYGGVEPSNFISYDTHDKFTYAYTPVSNNIANPTLTIPHTPQDETLEFRFKLINQENQIVLGRLDGGEYWMILSTEYISDNVGNLTVYAWDSIASEYYSNSIANIPIYNNNWWNFYLNYANDGSDTNISFKVASIFDDTYYNIYSASYTKPTTDESIQKLINGDTDQIGDLSNTLLGVNFNSCSCLIQEFRYWTGSLSDSDFITHTKAPRSYYYMNVTGSYDALRLKLDLGSDTKRYSGSNIIISSSAPNIDYNRYGTFTKVNTDMFIPQEDIYYLPWPDLSANRVIANKVRVDNVSDIPTQLLYNTRTTAIDGDQFSSSTPKIGIYLSPTNEINEDIAEQMGGFKIDNYIGSYLNNFEPNYPDLNSLRLFYSKKLNNKYNIYDYNRISNYYNDSLYNLLDNNLPAKAKRIFGLTVESNLLSRNKINLIKNNPVFSDQSYGCNIVENLQDDVTGLVIMHTGSVDCFTRLNSILNSYTLYTTSSNTNWLVGTYDGIIYSPNSSMLAARYKYDNIVFDGTDWYTQSINLYSIAPHICDISSFSGSIEMYITGSNIPTNITDRLKSRSISNMLIDRLSSVATPIANHRYIGCKTYNSDDIDIDNNALVWWVNEQISFNNMSNIDVNQIASNDASSDRAGNTIYTRDDRKPKSNPTIWETEN